MARKHKNTKPSDAVIELPASTTVEDFILDGSPSNTGSLVLAISENISAKAYNVSATSSSSLVMCPCFLKSNPVYHLKNFQLISHPYNVRK